MHLIISAWLLFALSIPVETVRVCLVFRRPAYHIILRKLFLFHMTVMCEAVTNLVLENALSAEACVHSFINNLSMHEQS